MEKSVMLTLYTDFSGRFLCSIVVRFIKRQMYACPVNRSRLEMLIMKHECKITVLEKKCFPELQEKYLADPKSGPCPFFQVGDTFVLKRTPQQDDFYHLMNGKFCGEAWDAVSRYVYTALQGGSIMKGWTNDDRMMIACCNDGTRPVIFKIERIDIPESDEERAWLEKQDFTHSVEDAYTG